MDELRGGGGFMSYLFIPSQPSVIVSVWGMKLDSYPPNTGNTGTGVFGVNGKQISVNIYSDNNAIVVVVVFAHIMPGDQPNPSPFPSPITTTTTTTIAHANR